jgi:hypothetical protein
MLEQKIELLAQAINNLAEAVCVRAQATNNLASVATTPKAAEEAAKAARKTVEKIAAEQLEEAPKAAQVEKTPANENVSLEQVRKVLLEKRAGGKGAEVAALVKFYGVASLDKIPEEKYPELLEKAGAL